MVQEWLKYSRQDLSQWGVNLKEQQNIGNTGYFPLCKSHLEILLLSSNLIINSVFVLKFFFFPILLCLAVFQQYFLSKYISSIQFSSLAQSSPTLCNPMNHSMPGLPVHHQLPEFTQTHIHRVSDAIQPSHPLSSPSPPDPNPSQHQSLFQ